MREVSARMPYPKVAAVVLTKEVPIAEGVEVSVEGDLIKVKGPLGELEKRFDPQMLEITVDENERKVILKPYNPRKFHKAYIGTIASHVKNMIEGVTGGFRKEMIIVFAHFPIKVEVDEERRIVVISNFLGERKPRFAKIVGEHTKVRVRETASISREYRRRMLGRRQPTYARPPRSRGKTPGSSWTGSTC